MEFDNFDSRPGKSWNFGPCPGTSHKLMLAKLYAAEMPTVLKCFSLTILNIIFLLCFSRTKYFNDHSKYSLKLFV